MTPTSRYDGRHRDADPTGAVALDELDVVDEVAARPDGLEAVEQQLRHRLALEAHHRLGDGGEVERPRRSRGRRTRRPTRPPARAGRGPRWPRMAPMAISSEKASTAVGGWGWSRHAFDRPVAAGDRESAGLQVRRDRRQSRLLHRAERAPQPQVGHVEVDRRVGLAADQADVLVAQPRSRWPTTSRAAASCRCRPRELVGPVAERGDGDREATSPAIRSRGTVSSARTARPSASGMARPRTGSGGARPPRRPRTRCVEAPDSSALARRRPRPSRSTERSRSGTAMPMVFVRPVASREAWGSGW